MHFISYSFSLRSQMNNILRYLQNAAKIDGSVKLDPIRKPTDLDSKMAEAGDKLVVLAILVEWCPYCQRIAPTVEDIASKNQVAVILIDGESVKANIKEWKYGVGEVTTAPTFIFIKRGMKIEVLDTSIPEILRKTVAQLVKKK